MIFSTRVLQRRSSALGVEDLHPAPVCCVEERFIRVLGF